MKILFFGDSITDMGRNRELEDTVTLTKGMGYPFLVESKLYEKEINGLQFFNRGIGGERIVDLYARIKTDVWNLKPDVLSVLVGFNDVGHEFYIGNGVDIERYETIYDMLIRDTKKVLPNVKIMLLAPFYLHGAITDGHYEKFTIIKDYEKVVERLATKHNVSFVPLQSEFDKEAKRIGDNRLLYDGVHPTVEGATIIANKWVETFINEIFNV